MQLGDFNPNGAQASPPQPPLCNAFFSESKSHLVVSDSLWPHGLYSLWDSQGQNTGVGICSLLKGIFPTQGSNPGLPHCRWIFTHWATGENFSVFSPSTSHVTLLWGVTRCCSLCWEYPGALIDFHWFLRDLLRNSLREISSSYLQCHAFILLHVISSWTNARAYLQNIMCLLLKPQWGTITRQPGWLLSKSLQAINAGEGVGKREPSYTVGGNAN